MKGRGPVLAVGAITVAGLGIGAHVVLGQGTRSTGPVPTAVGPVAVATAFTSALLAAEGGTTAALQVLERSATPELARSVVQALTSRSEGGAVLGGVVTSADVVEADSSEMVVLVEARVRTGTSPDPVAVAWPLRLRKVGAAWLVAGVSDQWRTSAAP